MIQDNTKDGGKTWKTTETPGYHKCVQACTDNKLHNYSVHPSITQYLYEDRDAVVG